MERARDKFPYNEATAINKIEGGPLGRRCIVQITRDDYEIVQFFPLQAGRARTWSTSAERR